MNVACLSIIINNVKPYVIFLFSLFFALPSFKAAAQEEPAVANGNGGGAFFSILPLIEAAFSGSLPWRPDWPSDIPPDAFSVENSAQAPLRITLSNGEEVFYFSRDALGRLAEFPFFLPHGGHLAVEADFSASGALQGMRVSGEAEGLWMFEFPQGFLPYSQMSEGGAFPAIRAYRGDAVFFVFIFEAQGFLTETWYDGEGNLIVFRRANVIHESRFLRHYAWRISSVQTLDESGPRLEEVFFDWGGNISAVRSAQGLFQAVYRGALPVLWQAAGGARRELQWDAAGRLVRAVNYGAGLPPEHRFMHETDFAGNWIRRETVEVNEIFGLLVPQQPYGPNVWTRVIAAPSM